MAAFPSVEICSHGEAVLFFLRQYFPYIGLDLVRLCVPGQPKAISDPFEMGVHNNSRLAEDSSYDHICTLSAYSGQLYKVFYSIGNNAIIGVQQLLRCGFYILCLGPEEACGMDQILKISNRSFCHLLRGRIFGKEARNHPHDLLVGGLGAEYHSDKELKVALEVQELNFGRVVGIQCIGNKGCFCLDIHTK